jgi:hypothetical protein
MKTIEGSRTAEMSITPPISQNVTRHPGGVGGEIEQHALGSPGFFATKRSTSIPVEGSQDMESADISAETKILYLILRQNDQKLESLLRRCSINIYEKREIRQPCFQGDEFSGSEANIFKAVWYISEICWTEAQNFRPTP